MSSPSHTCICLQIINWLSYLHTKTAQMLQTWQYKSHPKKKNSMHRLYWNIQHSFQNFPKKKLTSATIFSLWYKYLHFIDFIVNANYCNYSWKNTAKQQITKYMVCYEKSTKNRKENVKLSNNQEMSLQYAYIYEGKHWGNSPRLASEHKEEW